MPNAFDFSASPFDCLDEAEQKIVRDSVDIAYFREGEAILEPGIEPSHLFIIVKGHVSQFDAGEAVAGYGPNDCFDGRSLMAGLASSRFVAAEELVRDGERLGIFTNTGLQRAVVDGRCAISRPSRW